MQKFKDFYLLNETPDKSGGKTWAVPDSVAFGIIKNIGLCIKRSTHTNLYNDLYMVFITKKLQADSEIVTELKALGTRIIGNIQQTREIFLQKVRQYPWSLINDPTGGEEATEILRDEFFDISGRFWVNAKICSFWNMERNVQRYTSILKTIFESYFEHIEDFKFEFIERQGKYLTWWEVSGLPAPAVSPKEQETANKLLRLQHNSPEIKKVVANKGGGANKLASFAQAMGFKNPVEWVNANTISD